MAYYSAAERRYWYMNNLDEYPKNYDREKIPTTTTTTHTLWFHLYDILEKAKV